MKSDRDINPGGKGSCTAITLARTPDLVGACDNRAITEYARQINTGNEQYIGVRYEGGF
jgi:hypothetical protein